MFQKGHQSRRQHLLANEKVREKIAARAYEIFEERGQLHGYDKEDWRQAESEILSELIAQEEASLQAEPRIAAVEPGNALNVSLGMRSRTRGTKTDPSKTTVKGRVKKSARPKTKTKVAAAQELNPSDTRASGGPAAGGSKKSSASPKNRRKRADTVTGVPS